MRDAQRSLWRKWFRIAAFRLAADARGSLAVVAGATAAAAPSGWCVLRWTRPGPGNAAAVARFVTAHGSLQWAIPGSASANAWHARPLPADPWRASLRSAYAGEPITHPPPLDCVALGRVPFAAFVALQWTRAALSSPGRAATVLRVALRRLRRHGWRALREDARRTLLTRCEYAWWVEAFDMQPTEPPAPKLAAEGPLLSVVVPVFDTNASHLRECLASVLDQTYAKWELCIADDASTRAHVRGILEATAARDPRVRLRWRNANGHISAATNSALELATGEFVVFLDHDDVLAPHALATIADALSAGDVDLVYSDEDKLDAYGQRFEPHFKPDWNPALFLSNNYICHLSAIRRACVESVGALRRGYEGAQDYDLLLRVIRSIDASRIRHVPRVLYHWRADEGSTAIGVGAKPYAHEAGRRALQEHLDAESPGAEVVDGPVSTTYRVRWPLPPELPLVSILVAAGDAGPRLEGTLRSLAERTRWDLRELLAAVPHDAVPQLQARLRSAGLGGVRLVGARERSCAALVNAAASEARGSLLAFVDPGICVSDDQWLRELASTAMREGVAAASGKILQADSAIVAGAGMVLGVDGIAEPAFAGLGAGEVGVNFRAVLPQDASVLSSEFLVVRSDAFRAVGGFDVALPTRASGDVDLFQRLLAAGWRLVFTPYALAMRDDADPACATALPGDREAAREVLEARWRLAARRDPAYNPNLSLADGRFALAWPPRKAVR